MTNHWMRTNVKQFDREYTVLKIKFVHSIHVILCIQSRMAYADSSSDVSSTDHEKNKNAHVIVCDGYFFKMWDNLHTIKKLVKTLRE